MSRKQAQNVGFSESLESGTAGPLYVFREKPGLAVTFHAQRARDHQRVQRGSAPQVALVP